MGWREEEAEKNGRWTIWKEIVGTAIGVLPFLLTIGGALLKWGSDLQQSVAVDTQRIVALELQRNEISSQLNKISDKIDVLGQTVAAEQAIQNRR
jgi:hypothetical protein